GPRPGVARPPHPLAPRLRPPHGALRSEEHTSELQSRPHLVCRLLLETKRSQHNSYPLFPVANELSRRQKVQFPAHGLALISVPPDFFLIKGAPPGPPLFPTPALFD